MPRIYVEFSNLNQIGSDCKSIVPKIGNIKDNLENTVRQLDWDIRFGANINNTATQISRKLEQYSRALEEYYQFINDAHSEYVKLDEYKRLDEENIIQGQKIKMAPIVGPGGQAPKFGWKDLFKKIIISESHVKPGIIPLVTPVTRMLFITSGIYAGDTPSIIDKSRTPSASTNANWLGYELSEGNPGITAWLGKAGAETQNELGYAGVSATVGKVKAETKSDFSFMETKTKKEYKNGKWKEVPSTEFISAEIGAKVEASILEAKGKAGVGSDMLGADLEAEGSLGNAEASVKGEFSVGEKGVEIDAKGKAMVSAAEGKVQGSINILGLEIKGTVGGYAGALGVEGEIYAKNGRIKIEGGASAIIGGSVGLEVGYNETGWNNFIDAVTFWD